MEASAEVKATLTLADLTKSLQKNWWLIVLWFVLSLVGAGVSAALPGWWSSFLVSLGFDAVTAVIGIYAVIKVYRETKHKTCFALIVLGLSSLSSNAKAEEDYRVILLPDTVSITRGIPNIISIRREYVDQKIEFTGSLNRVEEPKDIFEDIGSDDYAYIAVVGDMFLCPLEDVDEKAISEKKPGDEITVRGKVARIDKIGLHWDSYRHIYFILQPCRVMPTVLGRQSMYYNIGIATNNRGGWAVRTGRTLDEAKQNAVKACREQGGDCEAARQGIDDHSGGRCYSLFRSGVRLYLTVTSPDSTTGFVETGTASAKTDGFAYCLKNGNTECHLEIVKCNNERP